MKLKVTVKGIAYDVEVDVVDEGIFTTNLAMPAFSAAPAAVAAPVAAPAASAAPRAAAPRPAAPAGAGALPAPVAGVILELKVKEGQQVKHGDTLLVLEAMKMQNNIAADRDGTISKICVNAGETVREGQALVEFA